MPIVRRRWFQPFRNFKLTVAFLRCPERILNDLGGNSGARVCAPQQGPKLNLEQGSGDPSLAGCRHAGRHPMPVRGCGEVWDHLAQYLELVHPRHGFMLSPI
eukprot:4176484-Prymnesium_polylepis.2